MALDLKKKAGPLPVWGWIVLGGGTLGVFYFLHRSSTSSSTTAATNATDAELAAEQAAVDGTAGAPVDTGDSGGGASGALAPAAATGTVTTDQLDADLQTIQGELSTFSQTPAVDAAPPPTIAQEASDLLAAQSALASLAGGGTSTGAGSGTTAAKAKSVAGLPILTQLDDLKAGLVTKAQLGSGATAALSSANGNVAKAIAARPATIAAQKPTQRVTTGPGKRPA